MRPLSPERIVLTCLDILDHQGPEGLTYRRLGKALGVDPSAIYRHFDSKDELILAVGDHLMATAMEGYEPPEAWTEAIREVLARSRRVYLTHPQAAVLSITRVTRGEGEMTIVEALLEALHRAGFDPAEAAGLYRVLDDANLAFAGLDAAFANLSPDQQSKDVSAWSREYAGADPERFPRITVAAGHLSAIDEEPTYRLVIDLLIDSIRLRAPGRREPLAD